MDDRMKRRLWILGATIAITSLCEPAPALNGDTRVISCACQTTTDFTNAAKMSAQAWDAGTYATVSSSTAMTAYVQVAGHLKITGENAVFVVTSTTPVDQNGNSLAGAPEPLLETYSVPGFGTGSDWSWQLIGDPLCTWAQTITIDGVESAPYYSLGPC